MIKFKTTKYSYKIESIEVISASKRMVVLKPCYSMTPLRRERNGVWFQYFDTWDEAYKYNLGRATHQVIADEESLEASKKDLDYVKSMEAEG